MCKYDNLKGDINMAACKPHFMEIIATAFAFIGGITAGGLLLGFLNAKHEYLFNNLESAQNLAIHGIDVYGVSGHTSGMDCKAINYPATAQLSQVKMSDSKGAGVGFLAAGIIVIVGGVAGLSHLSHLVRLKFAVD